MRKSAAGNSNERGFNGFEDLRQERVRSVREVASEYLEQYGLRHKVSFRQSCVPNRKSSKAV